MSTLRDDVMPLVDELRGLAGQFGFRQYQVWVRTVTWSGPRPGIGVSTVTEKRLLVGGQNPKVVEVHRKDVAAGDPSALDVEYDIGPFTPAFAGGGLAEAAIRPEATSTPTEIQFVLKGPGLPAEGMLCRKVSDNMDRPLRIIFRVRSIGRKRPVTTT